MVHWVQHDTNYAAKVAETLLGTFGLASASEAATALFPVAGSHPAQVAALLQSILGRPELLPEQVSPPTLLVLYLSWSVLEQSIAQRIFQKLP
jgi:hypothetical protein